MNINQIITTNALLENNLPTSTVEGDFIKHSGWAKCAKCSKEIGESYYHPVKLIKVCQGYGQPDDPNGTIRCGNCHGRHSTTQQVRDCYGKQIRNKANVEVNSLTGVTNIKGTDLEMFFDSSEEVCRNKEAELIKSGVKVIKVAKSTRGAKDWYVMYKKS